MSKIELTEQQTEKLRRVWLVETTHAKALVAVANELVAMGLVRPASDNLAVEQRFVTDSKLTRLEARVAAQLEPSEEEVEAGSKANFEDETDLSWERAREDVQEINRRGIRIILAAVARVRLEKAEKAEGEKP